MEPLPTPPEIATPPMMPPPAPGRLPRTILVGFILAGLGMLFTGILYGWNYFGFRGGLSTSFYTDLQIQVLLNLAELLLIQLGLFFIFLGGLRLLPSVRPWSKVGPIFILVGALIIAGFDIVEVVLFYPQGGVTLPDWASYVIVATVLAGSVLMTLGLLVSLFAVVKGILLRTPAAPNVSHL